MFANRSRRGPVLAGGILIAGTTALLAAGYGPWASPDAQIGGAPLDPASGPSAAPSPAEIAAFANLAEHTPIPSGAAKAAPAAPAPDLAALLDLGKIARQGDAYVATLTDGRRAVLTLDPRLQAFAEKLLDESRAPRAAIVAMTPDGKLLALAGRRTEEPKGAIKGTFDPRLAVDVWAPAASIFKLVTASALVRAGVGPDDKICFHGGLRSVLEHNLRDDKRDSRCESLSYGVAHSQNAILGKLAFQKLEPATLSAEAQALGWTAAVAGDLRGPAGELTVPAARDLELARTAAGFTGAKLSVLGGALLAATFAGGGQQPAVRLIASVDGAPAPAAPAARRAIPAETARAIARMMVGTCDFGSAARTFAPQRKIKVAGKTGTLSQSEPFYMEHSWFVGFAPADKPEIIVSVLLGNALDWHLRGHEAAKRLIDRALAPAPATSREKDRRSAAAAPPDRASITSDASALVALEQ